MAMACGMDGCGYKAGDNGNIKYDTKTMELEDLKLHFEMMHRLPAEMKARASADDERVTNERIRKKEADDRRERDDKRDKQKDCKIPRWIDKEDFESWEENYTRWCGLVDYSEPLHLEKLTTMLKEKESRDDVRDFFTNTLNNKRHHLRNDAKKVIDILRDRFGKNERERIREKIEKIRFFKYSENFANSLAEMEEVRGNLRNLLGFDEEVVTTQKIGEKVDTFLRHIFITEGMKEERITKESIIMMEEACKDKAWEDFREVVKKILVDFEKNPKETGFVKPNQRRQSRSPGRHMSPFRAQSQSPHRQQRGQSPYRSFNRNQSTGQRGQSPQHGQSPQRGQSTSSSPGRKTSISEDVITGLKPVIDALFKEFREETSKEIDRKLAITQSNYMQVQVKDILWTNNPKKKMGGTMDIGAPLTIGGIDWLMAYLEKNEMRLTNLKVGKSEEIFRFGTGELWPTQYTVVLPFTITDVKGEKWSKSLKVWIVKANIPLLVGKDAHKLLNIRTYPRDNTCDIGEKYNTRLFDLEETEGGHWFLEFESSHRDVLFLEEIESDDEFFDAAEEVVEILDVHFTDEELKTEKYKKVRSCHRQWNHKSRENMLEAYKSSGAEMTTQLSPIIEEVVLNCETCQKEKRSFSVPKVSANVPKNVNDILTLDLKFFDGVPVLWMIDAFSRFAV